jgi:Ca2+/H+ antiporter
MAGAAVVAAATVWDGTSRQREGMLLVAAYAAAVVGFFLGGGR